MSGQGKSALGQELALVRRCLAAVTLSLLALGSAAAGAAVRVDVQSGGGGVVVDASGATVAEILTALGETGDLHYRSSVNLGRTVSGTYKGTLQHVVSRLLDGYNFTLQVSDNRIEAVIIGLAGATPETGRTTAAAAASTAANFAAAVEAGVAPAPSRNVPNGGAANVAVRPSAPRPQSASPAANLASQLRTAAQLQVMNATTSAPAASSNPQAPDMASLTQQARDQLNALASSLQSVKP